MKSTVLLDKFLMSRNRYSMGEFNFTCTWNRYSMREWRKKSTYSHKSYFRLPPTIKQTSAQFRVSMISLVHPIITVVTDSICHSGLGVNRKGLSHVTHVNMPSEFKGHSPNTKSFQGTFIIKTQSEFQLIWLLIKIKKFK